MVGALVYGGQSFEFDDRVLAHLQAVISMKLRRREPFLISWTAAPGEPISRHAVWIDNSIPLRYEFVTETSEKLDDRWLNELMEMSSRTSGLVITPERELEAGAAAPAAG